MAQFDVYRDAAFRNTDFDDVFHHQEGLSEEDRMEKASAILCLPVSDQYVQAKLRIVLCADHAAGIDL